MMRLAILLALAVWPGVVAAQSNAQASMKDDARLAGCIGFMPKLQERLARCVALAGDAAPVRMPEDLVLRWTHAHVLTMLGRLPEAIAAIDRVLAVAPEHRPDPRPAARRTR